MIAAIVRKELLGVLRDGRFLLLAISVFVLLCGFFLASTDEYRRIGAEKQAIGATVREQWDHQGVKNPHTAAHFGIYVFKPDLPLAAVDPGLRAFTGQALWLEPHKRNLARFSPSADQNLAGRFGQTTVAFVLYALLPLMMIALAFNAISQEREHGTLRMLHCLGISGRQLLFGKFAGLLSAFVLVLLPAVVISLLMLYAHFQSSRDGLLRMLILTLALFIYYAIFAAVSMAVSAGLRNSRTVLFALLAFWLASVLVAPRLGAAAAELRLPTPDAADFWNGIKHDMQNGIGNDGEATRREAAFRTQVLKQYGVDKPEDLPVGYTALLRHYNDEYSSRVHELHFAQLRATFLQQQAWSHMVSWLGPSVAMRSLSMTLAGMDLPHQYHFEDAAERYRQYFIGLTDDWDRQRSHGTLRTAEGGNEDWSSVDDFDYRVPDWRFALGAAWPDVAVLLIWLFAALSLLMLASRRLQP
ncbi:DUF3526 domain-containing protein [Candidatus Methylospira mobilis]|uniref:DUF3526 domain-containing protein n=1 Tax=Candidatus Methylospira mobilis TaxID=1808979 RepID=UPI0028E84330|nr:DUF3526 domain-containing protein [Candidatus Methylospira mobilis]WNV06600.1 DUF3526 domain-containing protein [Candidatus Methylospira mobilis]